ALRSEAPCPSSASATVKTGSNRGLLPDSFLEPSLLLDFWKKADQKALQAVQKQEKIEKEKRIAEELQERWQTNTVRWKARAEAEQQERKAKEAEEKATSLLTEKLAINAQPSATKKVKQEASDAVATAKKEAEEAKKEAKKAQEEWLLLARNHHSVTSTHHQEEKTTVNESIDKLKQADQAINNLWVEITNLYDEDERNEDQFLHEERIKKEGEQYQITLLAKRETDITNCFKDVKKSQQAAKKKYDSSTTLASREEAQRLYEEVDQLELNARQIYTQIAKNDALAAARKRVSGTTEAWVRRITRSEEERKKEATAVTFKAPCKDSWADENQRSLARVTAIDAADKEAFNIYQKEEARLEDIATIWKAVIEAKRRAPQLRREKAAKSYAEGDPTEWETLSPEERAKYNNEIRVFNDEREEEITNNFQETKELAEKLREKADNAWRLFSKKIAEEAAQKAENEFLKLEKAEDERQIALRLVNLTPEERETMVKEVETTAKERIEELRRSKQALATKRTPKSLWVEAEKATKTAKTAKDKALAAPAPDKETLWDDAISKIIEAELVWTQTVEICRSLKNNRLEDAENSRKECSTLTLWWKAKKSESIANDVCNKVSTVSAEEIVESYDNAIQKRVQVESAWIQTIEACQTGLNEAPNSIKPWWIQELKTAENTKDQETAAVLWYKAKKAASIANIAKDKALAASATEQKSQETTLPKALLLWDEAIEKIEQSELAWNQTLEMCQKNSDLASPQYKEWWKTYLEKTKDIRNKEVASVLWYQASKADFIASQARDQAMGFSPTEQETSNTTMATLAQLWDDAIEKTLLVETAWIKTIEAYQRGLNEAPQQLKSWWITNLEIAKNSKDKQPALADWYQANKSTSIANIAYNKTLVALESGLLDNTSATQLKEEAIQRAIQAELAWTQMLESFTRGSELAPVQFKSWWIKRLEAAGKKKTFWTNNVTTWDTLLSQKNLAL
ncbi:MAG TPA: hypothetical protein VJK54_05870, partial [Chthoniobacterales bacterium]|nr:hypothetical protein [Chthoniobacterales bacterium]